MTVGITRKELAKVLSEAEGVKFSKSKRAVNRMWKAGIAPVACKICGSTDLKEDKEGRPYLYCGQCAEEYIVIER